MQSVYRHTCSPDQNRKKSVQVYNGITTTTHYSGSYEKMEVDDGTTATTYELHYISGGDGLAAIYVKENGSGTMYYAYTDYLGSILTLTDDQGNVVIGGKQSFDAWGRYRNPDDWTYDNIPARLPWLKRGFTGHEHLPEAISLINMNNRMYDPVVGRMMAVDNFVQDATSTQGYNRYSYAANNPLKFKDPNGDFIIIDSWLIGIVDGFFSEGGNLGERFTNGWREANQRASNDARIWGGLFTSDRNKHWTGQVWEVVSRFTWQLPQTFVGLFTAHSMNTIGGSVNEVNYFGGATVLDTDIEGGAFTISSYIFGPEGFRGDFRDHLFVHEYGHYIQSQIFGPMYLNLVALPSVTDSWLVDEAFNQDLHGTRWYESHASRLAVNYFDRHFGRGADDYFLASPNHFDRNSFINAGIRSPYVNPRNGGRNRGGNAIRSRFHWTDLPIEIFFNPFGLLGYL